MMDTVDLKSFTSTLNYSNKTLQFVRQAAYDQILAECSIPRITSPISYEEFLQNYLLSNRACVFESWLTDEWESRKNWVNESMSTINWDYLRKHYGKSVCPVADCSKQEYDTHPKSEMTLHNFAEYMLQSTDQKEILYLKDWHFFKMYPEHEVFQLPVYFQPDYLNEFCDSCTKDDYRFVYIGPKGSWTPFHSDVLRSHSWSANICGKKQWILLPPGGEDELRDACGRLPFNLDLNKVASSLTLTQNEGEVVFVPSGWHHQVLNLEDTISINHNWSNFSNLDLMLSFLLRSLGEVEREINDCRDMDNWNGHCQLILEACVGMNLDRFYQFVSCIAHLRLDRLKHDLLQTPADSPDGQLTRIHASELFQKFNADGQIGVHANRQTYEVNADGKGSGHQCEPQSNKSKTSSTHITLLSSTQNASSTALGSTHLSQELWCCKTSTYMYCQKHGVKSEVLTKFELSQLLSVLQQLSAVPQWKFSDHYSLTLALIDSISMVLDT